MCHLLASFFDEMEEKEGIFIGDAFHLRYVVKVRLSNEPLPKGAQALQLKGHTLRKYLNINEGK